MIDFSRTFCDLHPNELISNFCCKEQCFVGLCATCICSHTQSHIQKKTAPEYQNIRTTYSKMQQSIRSRITSLENQKNRINTIINIIQNKKRDVSEAVSQAKTQTIEFVHKFFEAKEKQLLRKIEADEKKLGLHNENRMDSLLNIISRDINTLFSSAQQLNSQNFLQSFHRIRTQILANSLQTQKQISGEIDKNDNYVTNIMVNPIYINDVKNSLEKCLSLNFNEKRPQVLSTTKLQSEVKQISKNSRIMLTESQNPSTMKRSESQPKLNYPVYSQPQTASTPTNQWISQPYKIPSNNGVDNYQQNYFSRGPQYVMRKGPEPFPMSAQPNLPYSVSTNSRIQFRGNSSQKIIKQNNSRNQINPNLIESNFNQNSQFSIGENKKIRKSGLTVLKTIDNQLKQNF